MNGKHFQLFPYIYIYFIFVIVATFSFNLENSQAISMAPAIKITLKVNELN